MRAAAEAFDVIVRTRPDYGKEAPEYHVAMVETLAWLTSEELAWLTAPRTGLHTVCRYLPTAADVHEFLRAERERRGRYVASPPVGYCKLTAEPGPWDAETDYERKRRVVTDLLGYDPDRKPGQPAPVIQEGWSSDDLRTKPAPPSPHLLALLERQRSA